MKGQGGAGGGIGLDDVMADPLGSLTKGWSLFSRAAVKTASTINETYVQPSVAKVSLPLPFIDPAPYPMSSI